jgi:Zn-dependent protease with chaperone function
VLLAGGFLLAIFVRAATVRPKFAGIPVPLSRFEGLRALIAECAVDAGIDPPEGLYLTPDLTAAAYSAGRLSLTRQGQHDVVFVGSAALLLMPRSDLKAILLHEFAHIGLRRRVLSVDICNKIYDFVPRFTRAHRHALMAIVTIVPFFAFVILWRAFLKSMNPLSRAEELVVDGCAADVTSARQYAAALTRFAVIHQAMQVKDGESPSLLTEINAAFYRALLTKGEGSVLNWFGIARRILDNRREDFWKRIEMVKDRVAVPPRAESGTHPSLTTRTDQLGQNLDVLLAAQGLWERAQTLDRAMEEELSADFALKARPRFYAASVESGNGLPETVKPCISLEFVCTRESCPRAGRPELSVSDSELRLYGRAKPLIVPWADIAYSKVITETSGFLSEIGVNIMAEIREAPSNRTLILQRKKGRKIVVPHWHCGANALEIEAWIERNVGTALAREGVTNKDAAKAAEKMTGRSMVKTTFWVLVVVFGSVFITMSVSAKYGYARGSSIETILIIAAIAWVMGRRR